MSGAVGWKGRAALAAAGIALAFGVASGCGGAQARGNLFTTDWSPSRSGQAVEAVYKRLRGTRPPPSVDLALGIAGEGDELVGVVLDTGARWAFKHRLDARPVVVGDVVVASGGDELFALDAKSGRKLWARPTGGLPLIGAGDDGSVTVVTLGPNSPSGTTLLAISRDGDVRRQVETDKNLGVPAVVGGLAFIPWGNQYVSVLDIVQGDEPARILLREKTSRAFAHGGELYFGEVGIFRFDEKIKDAPRNAATHVALPQRELPGTPLLFVPLDERTKLMGDARDRIHLYARPVVTDGDNLGLAGKRLYSTYFKYVMGLDDTAGALAWVHTHAADVIGAAAGEEGLVVCDERGKVTFLEAMHGQPVGERDLGKPVKACVVSVGSLRMGRPNAPAAPLVEQLARALALRDPQLAAAKQFLIVEVAKLDGEIATKSLLALVADAEGGAALDADVRAALAGRRSGARAMIAALERHYDFLGDVLKPPPVGAIAQALGAMKERSAAPVLATHLLDPANTEADVKDVADALAVVAGPGEVPSLRQFFVLGYASAESEPLQNAVVAVAAPLLRHGGKEGASLVERAAAGGMTQPAIQEKLRALLAPPAEGKTAPAKESAPPAEK